MSNVVDFPPDRQSRRMSAAESRAASADRATTLRTALSANLPMIPADQITVAEGVWRLLDRLTRAGVSKAAVLQKAINAKKEDSTKWLNQYALNPNRPLGSKAGLRLNKKPGRYIKIIDVAAELGGVNSNDALLEVFEATSLAASSKASLAAPEFEELARQLREVGGAVAVKYDLQRFFQSAYRAGVSLQVLNGDEDSRENRLDPDGIELHICSSRDESVWPVRLRQASDDFYNHWQSETVPLYPSVIIGEWNIGDAQTFHFDENVDVEHGAPATACGSGTAEGNYSAELILCIIPTGEDMRPEPALRIRIGLACSEIDSQGLYLVDPEQETVRFQVNGIILSTSPSGSLRVRQEGRSDWSGPTHRLWHDGSALPGPIGDYFPAAGNGRRDGCTFVPITGIIAQDWFSLDIYATKGTDVSEEALNIRALGHHLFGEANGEYFSPFKAGTIAAALDHCLTGRDGSDPLKALSDSAKRLVGLFGDAEALAKVKRDAGLARLDRRIQEMSEQEPSK